MIAVTNVYVTNTKGGIYDKFASTTLADNESIDEYVEDLRTELKATLEEIEDA